MPRNTDDWYQHLVDQSRTDHIYSLIYNSPVMHWNPDHELDFVCLSTDSLLEGKGKRVADAHLSVSLPRNEWSFPDKDYVLLNDDCLTDYLELARAMRIVADMEDREFIELVFTAHEEEEIYDDDDEGEYDAEAASEEFGPIYSAYELMKMAKNKEGAYQFAKEAEAYLDSQDVYVGEDTEASLYALKRKLFGYNIVAMVYAWNDRIDEAARVDTHYIHRPDVWDELEEYIQPYLEMLMAKQQGDYLKHLFGDDGFRRRFWPHYEAYVSLLVDNTYHFTRMMEAIPIINRVNNAYKGYL